MTALKADISNLMKILRCCEWLDEMGYGEFESAKYYNGVQQFYGDKTKVEKKDNGLLLGVHLEMAYEALFRRGYLSKEELIGARKRIIERHYATAELDPDFYPDFCPDIVGDTPEEMIEKAALYRKVAEFYLDKQDYNNTVLEILKHTEAMGAKLKLGIGSLNRHTGPPDRELFELLMDYYLDLELDTENMIKRNRIAGRAALANRDLERIFSDE